MTNYALNNLIEIFRQIQVGHEQINDFYFGDVANLSGNRKYPLLLVDIDSTSFNENQTKFRFNCFVLDKLQPQFENANEVYSDTLRVQEDIFTYLDRNKEYEFAVNPDAELERVLSDINSDFVAGWNMKVEVDVPFGGDICSIPGLVTSTPFFESSDSESNPMFLTCENLSSCSTFVNHLNTKANLSGATFTGNIYAPVISGGTIFSGATDLSTIIASIVSGDGNDITRVQPGMNIYTGGTANNPTVNISAATLSFLSVTGTSNLAVIQSGGTDLYNIFLSANDGNDITRVQPGLNIYTGGTANNPTVNISAATLSSLSVTGTSNLSVIHSGGTDLYNIFLTANDGNDITRVQPGMNIYTGGTANYPTLNISAGTLSFLSAYTLSAHTEFIEDKIEFSGNNNINISTKVSIPNITANSNWSIDGNFYAGTWQPDPQVYNYNDLVDFGGDIYQNQFGSNGTDDPSIDNSNWILYANGYTGIWNSASTYSLGTVVSYNNDIYYHVSDTNEVYAGRIKFDGTKFIFGNNQSNWAYISGNTLVATYLRPPSGSLNLNASSFIGLNASSIQHSSTNTLVNYADRYYTAGIQLGDEINIQNNDISSVSSGSGVKRALFLGARSGIIGIGSYNSALIGGQGNKINDSVSFSVVLGGSGITGDTGNCIFAPNARLAETTGSRIYSAGTDLYNIFSTTDTNDITRVQPGANITTGGTANNPIISVAASPSFNAVTASGSSSFTTLTASTFVSGSTNLYTLINYYAQVYQLVNKASVTIAASTTTGRFLGTSQENSGIRNGVNNVVAATVFPLNSANYPPVNGMTAKFRVRVEAATNNTGITANYRFGLAPVVISAATAVASNIAYSAGTFVNGTTADWLNPPAATFTTLTSSDFSIPANGDYCLLLSGSATNNAASALFSRMYLEVHYT